MSWVLRLHQPIHLDDGRIIETLADARALVLSLPDTHRQLKKWQEIAHSLMRAAVTGNEKLLAVVEGKILQALIRPPRAPVTLFELPPKKPVAKSVRRRPSKQGRRRGAR